MDDENVAAVNPEDKLVENDDNDNENNIGHTKSESEIDGNVENSGEFLEGGDDKSIHNDEREETDENNNIPTNDLDLQEQNTAEHDLDVEKEETQRDDQEEEDAVTDTIETSQRSGQAASIPPTPKSQTNQESDTNVAGEGEAKKSTESPLGTASTLQVKSGNRKHTTTPADDSGLVQPILPAIPRGQAKVQQIASSISDARKKDISQPTIYKIRNRVPPKLVRLATVTVSPVKARTAAQGPSLYYEEPRKPQKVITWDQAYNARPPLQMDMEGPGPCTYSPLNKPLNETNAPAFTFGTKCYPEKPAGVGSRTSWSKSWFQSSHPYHCKADYVREGLWPSPTHYPKSNAIGPRQMTMYQAPSYTFGHKQEFSIVRRGAHKEPSPTDYERQNADRHILRRGPSYSHQFRREGTILWGSTESNPGPAAYTPQLKQRQQKPSYSIQGIRRSKSHILGPFSTI